MSELDDRQLDRAIRDLVGRAAADAPAAPTLDDESARRIRLEPDDDHDRRRWMVTGIAGLSIAAAVVGLLVVNRPDDDAEAPSTQPSPVPTATDGECPDELRTLSVAVEAYFAATGRYPENEAELVSAQMMRAESGAYDLTGDGPGLVRVAGVPCAEPNGTVPTDETGVETVPITAAPVTSPATSPSTVPDSTPTSTPTTTAPPPAAGADEVIMIAGLDGIQIDTGDALAAVEVGGGTTTAHRVPDGRVFFQYRAADRLGIYIAPAADGAPLDLVPMPPDWSGTAILHDVAVVDGEVVLLVESSPGLCSDPNACLGSVWALWPDRGPDGAGTKLDEQIVWESGYSQLSLSSTGVVVGMKSAEVSSSPWSIVLPGSTATPLDPSAVGLEVDYIDCSTCPTGLTIDSTGSSVGWWQRGADGVITISVRSLDGGSPVDYVVEDGTDLPLFGSLDIGRLGSAAIINDRDPETDSGAVVFDLTREPREPIVVGKPGEKMAFSA